MTTSPTRIVALSVLLGLAPTAAQSSFAAQTEVQLKNPSFEEGVGPSGVPVGWNGYKRMTRSRRVIIVDTPSSGTKAALLHDSDPTEEIGIIQQIPASSGVTYEVSVSVRRLPGAGCSGSYLQMRFCPVGKIHQTGLAASSDEKFNRVSLLGTAPEGTKTIQIYLYTHHEPTPQVIVDDVRLVAGVEAPQPPPKPIPPVYRTLKKLYLTTHLVTNGRPTVSIVAPASGVCREPAVAIQQAVERMTGVRLPLIGDDAPGSAVPLRGNLIVLGNRSTNRTICALYDAWYTMLDLKYPGREGHVVRTVHNPYGNGHNVILVGGSDDAGVAGAAQVLIKKLGAAGPTDDQLSIGWTMDIKLGRGLEPVTDVKDYMKVEHWDASIGYQSGFCFGWAMHSKLMAMYHMTGEEAWLREFKRVALPDAGAVAYLRKHEAYGFNDAERPLSKPYHYSAFTMVLLWDLVEESPLFTDAERLEITNAFAQQLAHWAGEHAYETRRPPSGINSRHPQWSRLCMYVLGRYFQKYYPDPRWKQAMAGPTSYFRFLHPPTNAVVTNESSFWLATLIQPVFTWMTLSGDRTAVETGHLRRLLGHLELLSTGEDRCWVTRWSSLSMLNRAAYLLNDGRWVFYRDRLGMDTDVFRLGHSFWPEPTLESLPPAELAGKWRLYQPTEKVWAGRNNRLPFAQSFYNASYRSAIDESGDFVLLDGCYAGAGRGSIHSYAIQMLRLDGCQLLAGHGNQVLTSSDGMMEPGVAKDGALVHTSVVGNTAVAVGGSPYAAYCDWRRSIVLRKHRYALIVDGFTFRADSENMEAQIRWETPRAARPSVLGPGVLQLEVLGESMVRSGWHGVRALDAACTTNATGEQRIAPLDGLGIMLLIAKEPGVWIEVAFTLGTDLTGEVFVDFLKYKDRGTVRMLLDSEPVGNSCDLYSRNAVSHSVSLGQRELKAGEHRLRVETVAVNAENQKCYVGLAGVSIRPSGLPAGVRPPGFDVCLSDPVETTSRARLTTMSWRGAVRKGENRVFFSTIARNPRDANTCSACARVSGNVAALALPQPAVAVVGRHESTEADVAVLAADHLYGHAMLRAGWGKQLLEADEPIDVDWDFVTGSLHIVANKATKVLLSSSGQRGLDLEPGRHVIRDVRPDAVVLSRLKEQLGSALRGAQTRRHEQAQSLKAPTPLDLPELTSTMSVDFGGKIAAMETVPSDRGTLICAATGNVVHVLTQEGRTERRLAVDASVRVLRWWQEHGLLLVGCADKRVIAFDRDGRRKWVFKATLAPRIASSNQQGWASHPGIFGLHTGVFIDGKSQAFVGSACTIEIVDASGRSLKNLAAPWGNSFLFTTIDAPDGSRELVSARWPNGYDNLHIVNSRTLALRTGFNSWPAGHTAFSPWTGVNRVRLMYEDLDGDGTRELVSAVNGDWNRVAVWAAGGKILHSVHLGPGRKGPGSTIPDMDVADLDGDGKKEILVAKTDGLLVALDHNCEKIWSRRLPSAPRVLRCVSSHIVTGCDDGTVLALDATGTPVRMGKMTGTPSHIAIIRDRSDAIVYLGGDKGQVKAFKID